MQKFWNWVKNEDKRTLFLNGAISETSWFDDDVTPALFKSELEAGEGDIDLWINSPGGDCFAAAQIYNMISNYHGRVTVYIDGLAASAASVIAMAGDEVIMSPVSMFMIHNPSTIAMGEASDMEKVITMLGEVKDSIINAYALKTGLSRNKLSRLMDDETWMNANKAVELGFADCVKSREGSFETGEGAVDALIFSQRQTDMYVTNLLKDKCKPETIPGTISETIPGTISETISGTISENISETISRSDTPKPDYEQEIDKDSQTIVDNISALDTPQADVPDSTPAGRSIETLNERMKLMKNFLGGK